MEQHVHRKTAQRAEILKAIFSAKKHLSADQVFASVKGKVPGISLGTVYRNLRHLSEDGILSSVEHEGRTFFEKPGGYHAHFECVRCDGIFDFPSEEPAIPAALGRVISSRLSVKGICRRCL